MTPNPQPVAREGEVEELIAELEPRASHECYGDAACCFRNNHDDVKRLCEIARALQEQVEKVEAKVKWERHVAETCDLRWSRSYAELQEKYTTAREQVEGLVKENARLRLDCTKLVETAKESQSEAVKCLDALDQLSIAITGKKEVPVKDLLEILCGGKAWT